MAHETRETRFPLRSAAPEETGWTHHRDGCGALEQLNGQLLVRVEGEIVCYRVNICPTFKEECLKGRHFSFILFLTKFSMEDLDRCALCRAGGQ